MMMRLRVIAVRIVLFSVLWLVLAGWRWDEWWLIAIVIGASVASSMWYWPPGDLRIRVLPLLAFVPYFITQSVLGGWDVARRAFAPSLPIDPGFVAFELRLTSPPAVTTFAWIVSLLPGTASTQLEGSRLLVHVLDATADNETRLRDLETRVGRVFVG
jgi:multicomponent Na+:H+ antiporter subunit E